MGSVGCVCSTYLGVGWSQLGKGFPVLEVQLGRGLPGLGALCGGIGFRKLYSSETFDVRLISVFVSITVRDFLSTKSGQAKAGVFAGVGMLVSCCLCIYSLVSRGEGGVGGVPEPEAKLL